MVVMKRTLLMILAWSTATVLAVGVAAAAVGSVRGQVTRVPSSPGVLCGEEGDAWRVKPLLSPRQDRKAEMDSQ